ncbi:MAG: DNA mismatch repair endonuclease MutL [Bacilli bacterium]|nr:DNA mismatch repair endonuclease MutL [Bacilli bacterium]
MAVIKIMDEILSNKIAAGEVVERCSSVVKELVENSIDAKATEIKVELKESGIKEIKVIDNGIGMDKEDAVMAFNRHATSKIIDEDDLYHIHTLGFRGEALASIASVTNVDLYTSKGDVGTHVNIKGGKVISVENSDARVGTIISVKDLFFNTPARLKHLKSLYTELSNIMDYMNKIALSHPEIRFVVSNDGKELLRTDGSNNLLKCIKNIFGINIAKKMLEINSSNSDYKIDGYISLPEVYKTNRNSIVTIVNGRIVRNTELNRTINDSYHSYKPDNYYPVVVLNITVDTSLVDVNIHPTKMDIKFGNIEELLDLVSTTIKDSLKKKTLIPHIEEKPTLVKETRTFEEIKLDFDVPIVSEVIEDYVINEDLIEEETELNEDNIDKMPIMYPIGLVHGTYIICQNEIGMYIIDQHAAKERINYEIVKDKLNSKIKESISMLFPLTIEYTSSEYLILKENFEFLRELNFDIEEFGINSVIVKAHPVWLPKGNEDNSIKKILELVIAKEKNFNLDKFNDNVAATMACKMSIKANTNITMDEMENLINDLRKCKNPFNCPHGRPTIIYYSKNDLEKLFKRSGF